MSLDGLGVPLTLNIEGFVPLCLIFIENDPLRPNLGQVSI